MPSRIPEIKPLDQVLYSVTQVANLLSVSRGTVYNEIHARRIRTCLVGRKQRITAKAIQAYIRTLDQESRSREAAVAGMFS